LTPIQGYESKYAITDDGNIFSYHKGDIVNPVINSRGYYIVPLYKDGKRKNVRIHRLIAIHFIPNQNKLPEVNHIDGNKLNNRPDNLEWCTRSENMQHAYSTGLARVGEDHCNAKLTQAGVDYCRQVCVKRHPEFGVKALARQFGVSPMNISYVINGHTWNN
jgi:hypothetical protein